MKQTLFIDSFYTPIRRRRDARKYAKNIQEKSDRLIVSENFLALRSLCGALFSLLRQCVSVVPARA